MGKYDLPKHVKVHIEHELYDYKGNKKLYDEMREDILNASPGGSDGQPRANTISDTTEMKAEKLITSRSLLLVAKKIQNIENVLNRLPDDEKEFVGVYKCKWNEKVEWKQERIKI